MTIKLLRNRDHYRLWDWAMIRLKPFFRYGDKAIPKDYRSQGAVFRNTEAEAFAMLGVRKYKAPHPLQGNGACFSLELLFMTAVATLPGLM
jgi:hypothetical protein